MCRRMLASEVPSVRDQRAPSYVSTLGPPTTILPATGSGKVELEKARTVRREGCS